jgi:hypothetical protein
MSAVGVQATERDHSSRLCRTSGCDFRKLGIATASTPPQRPISAWSNVIDAHGDNIAAAKFAVDRQIEECKIPLLALDLELGPDRPDVAWA